MFSMISKAPMEKDGKEEIGPLDNNETRCLILHQKQITYIALIYFIFHKEINNKTEKTESLQI